MSGCYFRLWISVDMTYSLGVDAENDEGREERLRRGREHDRLQRERDTDEERHTRFVQLIACVFEHCIFA